jgi:hypothetical protein
LKCHLSIRKIKSKTYLIEIKTFFAMIEAL